MPEGLARMFHLFPALTAGMAVLLSELLALLWWLEAESEARTSSIVESCEVLLRIQIPRLGVYISSRSRDSNSLTPNARV